MTATLTAARAIESRRDATYSALHDLWLRIRKYGTPEEWARYWTLLDYCETLSADLQAALIGETPDLTDDHDPLCPECNGAGCEDHVSYSTSTGEPMDWDAWDCPVCHGDGTLHAGNSQPVIDTTNLRRWEEGQG